MKKFCRNCYHPLTNKAKYCAFCGQKDTDGRVGMGSLMIRLWNNTFHLEGKFIRTAWQLFVPGKMTAEFFKGKQERYPHPIRLFAIVMFLFLFLLNSMLKDRGANGDGGFYFDGLNVEIGDSVEQKSNYSAYERMKYSVMRYDLKQDYERLPDAWKTPQAKRTVDSLLQTFSLRYEITDTSSLNMLADEDLDSIGFGQGMGGVQISTLDLVRYEPDELIRRYHVQHWFQKLMVRQGIKSYKTPDALVHAMVGSLTWAILALVALMSGVLALLYWRQHRYYVEHFIFLLHFHTGVMLLLLLAIVGERIGLWETGMVGFAAFLPLPAMYFALRRYYGQGGFKTFVKWLLYGFFYLFAFVILFVLGMIVVFALF